MTSYLCNAFGSRDDRTRDPARKNGRQKDKKKECGRESKKMRCLRLAASLSLIFCVVALADDSPLDYAKDAAFQSWCMQFCEKTNPDYLSRIYPTWRRNADYVAQQNRLELSYSVSLNRFAHLVSGAVSGLTQFCTIISFPESGGFLQDPSSPFQTGCRRGRWRGGEGGKSPSPRLGGLAE